MFDRRHPLGWLFFAARGSGVARPAAGNNGSQQSAIPGVGGALARVTNPVSIAAEQRVPMTASGDRCGRQRRPHPVPPLIVRMLPWKIYLAGDPEPKRKMRPCLLYQPRFN
jgi:hypothetical protein